MIKVLIVDDHAFVRASLRVMLEGEADIEVVGECVDGAHAVEVAAVIEVDVVLMDVRMPRMCGIDATRALLTGDRPLSVILMTSRVTGDHTARAAAAGAAHLLPKGGDPEVLLTALRTAAEGTAWASQSKTAS